VTDSDINTPPEAGLPRALWRGRQLIDLGSDDTEEDETRLSDVLADLMHWADYNHLDWESVIAQATRARTAELEEWDVVQVSITSTYEDGHESEVEVWVPAPEGGTMPTEDWWQDEVFEHTGDGHGAENPGLGSFYEATIIRVSDPNDTTMCGLSYDWSD
jgi:hypothetical protein